MVQHLNSHPATHRFWCNIVQNAVLGGQLFACGGREGDIYHTSAECFRLPSQATMGSVGSCGSRVERSKDGLGLSMFLGRKDATIIDKRDKMQAQVGCPER